MQNYLNTSLLLIVIFSLGWAKELFAAPITVHCLCEKSNGRVVGYVDKSLLGKDEFQEMLDHSGCRYIGGWGPTEMKGECLDKTYCDRYGEPTEGGPQGIIVIHTKQCEGNGDYWIFVGVVLERR